MTSVYPSQPLLPRYANPPLGGISPNTYSPAGVGGFFPPSRFDPPISTGGRPGVEPTLGTRYGPPIDSRHHSPYGSAMRGSSSSTSSDSLLAGTSPPRASAMAGSRARSRRSSHSSRLDRKVEFGLPPDYIPTTPGPSPRGLGTRFPRSRSLTPPPLSPRGSAVQKHFHGDAFSRSRPSANTLRVPSPYYESNGAYSPSHAYGNPLRGEDRVRRRPSPSSTIPYSPNAPMTFPQEIIPAGTMSAIRPHDPSQGHRRRRSHSHSQPQSSHHHDRDRHRHHRHHRRDAEVSYPDSSPRPAYSRRRSRSLPPASRAQDQPLVYRVEVPPQPHNVQYVPADTSFQQRSPRSSSHEARRRARRRAYSSAQLPPMQLQQAPMQMNQSMTTGQMQQLAAQQASLPMNVAQPMAPMQQAAMHPYQGANGTMLLPPASQGATAPPPGSQTRPPHTGFVSSLLKGIGINKTSNHPPGAGPGLAAGVGSGRSAAFSPRAREREMAMRAAGQQQVMALPMNAVGGGYGGYGYSAQSAMGLPTTRRRERRMSF